MYLTKLLLSTAALQDSIFTTPMIFHYENCMATPSPFTFDLYYASIIESNHGVEGYPIVGGTANQKQTFRLHGSTILSVIALHPPTRTYGYIYTLNYYCEKLITQYYSSADQDPTVSLIASAKWPNFTLVYSLLPFPRQPDILTSQEYNYYLLFGSFRPRNCIDAFAIVAVSPDITNVTIKPTVDLVALQNGRDMINITANSTETISMEENEVLWIEVMTENCRSERNLSGLLVKATQNIQVFTANAQCSEPNMFSYNSHVLHQMPPSYRWGKTYVTDLLQLNILPVTSTNSTIVSFTFLAIENMTNVTITWYRDNHQQNDPYTTSYTLTSGKPFITTFDSNLISNDTTHVFIQGSNSILVLYELYSSVENKMYFSVLLQPVEWFSNQQSAVLIKPLQQATELQYHITLVVPTKFYDPHNILITDIFESNQSLDRYDHFNPEHVYTAGDFFVIYMEINSTVTEDNQVLIRHSDSCAKLGVSVYSYATDTTGYAYSNGYVLSKFTRLCIHISQYVELYHTEFVQCSMYQCFVPTLVLLYSVLLPVYIACFNNKFFKLNLLGQFLKK